MPVVNTSDSGESVFNAASLTASSEPLETAAPKELVQSTMLSDVSLSALKQSVELQTQAADSLENLVETSKPLTSSDSPALSAINAVATETLGTTPSVATSPTLHHFATLPRTSLPTAQKQLSELTTEFRSSSKTLDPSAFADRILGFVRSHPDEIKADPTLATRAHEMLNELAQNAIAKKQTEVGFKILSDAASTIPLPETNPLQNMDQAIIEGSNRQLNPLRGANFSHLDSSIVKCGSIHANHGVVDGKMMNRFDFKLTHQARKTMDTTLKAITYNNRAFTSSIPEGFCDGVKILKNVPDKYYRYDAEKGEHTSKGAYQFEESSTTEIVFEGVGKVIIGNNPEYGCLHNRVRVEMEAGMDPGEGAKKLQMMLALTGLGPVLGEQPPENNERMKIAQLCRAFCPAVATKMDRSEDFHHLSIDALKSKITKKAPEMEEIFTKYLEESPELMKEVEVLPGKVVWGVSDLGEQIRENGGWGLMRGLTGNNDWEQTKASVTQALREGNISTEQRFSAGVFREGVSAQDDIMSGGADQVFTRMITDELSDAQIEDIPWSSGAQLLIDIDSAAQRVPYGFYEDKFGVRNQHQDDFDVYEERQSLPELAANITDDNLDNEIMLKDGIDPTHVKGIVVPDAKKKQELIEHLINEGIAVKHDDGLFYVGGKKVEDFVHAAGTFTKQMWD